MLIVMGVCVVAVGRIVDKEANNIGCLPLSLFLVGVFLLAVLLDDMGVIDFFGT
jgi:hypothetical protein